MDRGSAHGREFRLPVRDQGQEGWITARDLFQQDDQRLGAVVDAYGRDFMGTDNQHLAASGFIIAYLTPLVYPLISQYVWERRVIDVSLDNLEFHTNGERFDGTALASPGFAALPHDPAAGHPDAEILPDEAALYDRLKERLFDANFGVVIPSLRRSALASVKVSWNAVAASCAAVFERLYELSDEPESVMRQAEAFYADPSSPMYGQMRMEVIERGGKRACIARRAGCCLFWRVRETQIYCSNCILLSDEDQNIRFAQIQENPL